MEEKETYAGKTEIIAPQVKEKLKQMMQESERTPVSGEDEEEAQIRRMAVPSWSAAQIAEAAKNQGDAPDIVKDDVTKVTLLIIPISLQMRTRYPARKSKASVLSKVSILL